MELNFKRIVNLALRYLAENARSVLKVLLTISSVILIIACLSHIDERMIDYEAMVVLFYIFMFVGGFWFSSNVFKEIHNPSKSYRYLTLPASNIEKLLNAWIITSPVFVIISFIMINITSWLLILICSLWMETNFELLDLFNDFAFGKIALLYIVIQPVFLLGALLFKKLNFFNTILWIIVSGIAIAIITSLLGFLIFYPTHGLNFDDQFWKLYDVKDFFENRFVPAIEFIFWYITAPFFLVCSYFRLKETEIS